MSVGRIRFRPPGVKTGSRVGPLGPFRGTLGIHWVIASVAMALVILLAVSFLLFKTPGPPFELVATVDSIRPGSGREVLAGVFLGRTVDGQPYAVAEPANCPLEFEDGYYLDCSDRKYGLDGKPATGQRRSLTLLPIEVHGGDVYVDPTVID
jgi:hypothetical protein